MVHQSAPSAGRLGLPVTLGYIGGSLGRLRRTVDAYRAAGERAGHPEKLRVGLSTHFYAGPSSGSAREVYPYYHEYLRPKTPGGRGWLVTEDQFAVGTQRQGAIMVGSSYELIEKILDAYQALGIDRFFGQVDWGGIPEGLVAASIERFANEIAPAVRSMVGSFEG